jgi:hypothetical protein
MRPLRILLTNNTLAPRGGTEMYVRDLALALLKRGHFPVAYSPVLGLVADELRDLTIPVIDDLAQMARAPDLIHGHHHHEIMTALMHYPETPAIAVCHGWVPWPEMPVAHPNIMAHIAVDDLCRERLLTTGGIDPDRVSCLYNFVDCDRYRRIRSLPERPRKALVFSNYSPRVPEPIRQACEAAGIDQIDIAGLASRQVLADPENHLAEYDIVFAKARAALEAMASGCAVIVTHQQGVAGLVTPDNMAALRQLNFGARTMKQYPLDRDVIARELALYDPQSAAQVTRWIRETASLDQAVVRWEEAYASALQAWKKCRGRISANDRMQAAAVYLRRIADTVKQARQTRRELADERAETEALKGALKRAERQIAELKSRRSAASNETR